jgi:hypothetical protein
MAMISAVVERVTIASAAPHAAVDQRQTMQNELQEKAIHSDVLLLRQSA